MGVRVGVRVGVLVGVGVVAGVRVRVGVMVGVRVAVGVRVRVGVMVGVRVSSTRAGATGLKSLPVANHPLMSMMTLVVTLLAMQMVPVGERGVLAALAMVWPAVKLRVETPGWVAQG